MSTLCGEHQSTHFPIWIERVQLFYFTKRGTKISNKFPACFGKLAYMWRDTPPFICCIFLFYLEANHITYWIFLGTIKPVDYVEFMRRMALIKTLHEASAKTMQRERERQGTPKKKSTLGSEKLSHVPHCNFYSILKEIGGTDCLGPTNSRCHCQMGWDFYFFFGFAWQRLHFYQVA